MVETVEEIDFEDYVEIELGISQVKVSVKRKRLMLEEDYKKLKRNSPKSRSRSKETKKKSG